jgi:ADP-dependent NAD(P)H-hydrate dehydratase
MPTSHRADPPVAITPALLRGWPLPLPEQGDKNVRGTVLVIGGSPETPGAVLLAGLGALRAGAGRLQLATCGAAAPVVGLPGDVAVDVEPALKRLGARLAAADAVLVGPGFEPGDWLAPLIEGVLEGVGPDTIVVLDAAALICLSHVDRHRLLDAGGRIVVTPNRHEALILSPGLSDDADVGPLARAAARQVGGVATLHGEVASADGRAWATGTGGIGLGTSGSGDVLAGVVAGLAARGGDAAQAACWGAYLHGTAGDRLSARIGPVGFLARELLDEIPTAMAELSR